MNAELEAIALCQRYNSKRWSIDFYATAIFASMVTIFGVLGNAATLLTLSGSRLTTATFVYYRTIAVVDLLRCLFVFTYVLRVLMPFRSYFWTTWYEAHLMYLAISTLGFVSTSLAVFLCFRLCIGIVKSTRMKKTKANPSETRKVIYGVLFVALLVNVWLCFEYDVVEVVEDACSIREELSTVKGLLGIAANNRSVVEKKKFSLTPSRFNFRYAILLKAVHTIPTVILLMLLAGTVCLLILCVLTLPGLAQHTRNTILTANNAALTRSKPWRTQRQLCHLFIFLSISYACGLLPSLLHYFFFGTDSDWTSGAKGFSNNDRDEFIFLNETHFVQELFADDFNSSTADSLRDYENELVETTRRHMFAAVMNVFQNFAHALSFYVYATCSEAFRNEFFIKIRRLTNRLLSTCPCLECLLVYFPMTANQVGGSSTRALTRRRNKCFRDEHDVSDTNGHGLLNGDVARKYNSAFVVRNALLSEADDESDQAQLAATVL